MFLNLNTKINVKFEPYSFFVVMNQNVSLNFLFIIFFSILFTGKSVVRAQAEDEIPILDIDSSEFIICLGDEMITQVSVSGTPPVFIIYTHNGEVDSLVSLNDNVMDLHLADTGFYYFTEYGDSTHTVTTSEQVYVDAFPLVEYTIEGGGMFCNYEEPIPITVNFQGLSPYTITYLENNVRFDISIDSSSYTFSNQDDFNIIIRKVGDKNCTVDTYHPASISIVQIPEPTINGDTSVCLFSNALYTNHQQGYTPQWEVPLGAQSREGVETNGSFVAVTWIVPGTHTVNLKLTDLPSGCESPQASLTVEILEQPVLRENFDTIICFDFESLMHIELQTSTGDSIYWPGLNTIGPSVDIYETGTYSYIYTDQNSCADTGLISITEVCIPEFHVPEAFTPNGDQINDLLELFGVYFNLKFSIYSPAGQKLFYTEDSAIYWDGTYKGRDLPNGRYYWHADYTDKYGLPYSNSGYVMLIR